MTCGQSDGQQARERLFTFVEMRQRQEIMTPPDDINTISRKVLCVDDDRLFLEAVKRRLRKDFEVVTAVGGEAALRTLEEEGPFAVVLSDFNMPGMNGVEFLKRSQEHSPETVTAMLTGQTDLDVAISALHEGRIFRFLNKPCTTEKIAKTLNDCLAQYRLVVSERILSAELNLANDKLMDLNRDLEQRVIERTATITSLYGFVSQLSGLDSIRAVGKLVVNTVVQQAKCRHATLFLYEPIKERLCLVAAEGLTEHDRETSAIVRATPLIQSVFDARDAIILNRTDEAQVYGQLIGNPESLPLAAIALATPDEVLGVLCAASPFRAAGFDSDAGDTLQAIAKASSVAIQNQTRLRERNDARDATILAFAHLAESRDPETGAHLERVQEYCRALCQELAKTRKYSATIDGEYIEAIVRSSPLHDIGKVGIPDDILRKPGKLTAEEFEIMKRHTVIGGDTIRQLIDSGRNKEFLQMSMEIAYAHHEKYNGSGYPHGLAGAEIPLAARIMALADVYDAITSKRVYKDAMPHEKAAEIIRSDRGKHFDPDIVDAFNACENRFRQLASDMFDTHSPGECNINQVPSAVQPLSSHASSV